MSVTEYKNVFQDLKKKPVEPLSICHLLGFFFHTLANIGPNLKKKKSRNIKGTCYLDSQNGKQSLLIPTVKNYLITTTYYYSKD